jgi:uncharacterized membrane protein required for colicin V production
MNLIVDLVLVVILLVGLVLGYKRGFVKTVAKPVKLVAVWFCTIKSCSAVAARFIAPLIQSSVTEKLSNFLQENYKNITASNVSEEMPTLLKIAAGVFDIDIQQVVEDAGLALTEQLAETFTAPLVSLVSIVIAFVLLLIVFSVLFSVVLWIINGIFHIGPLLWFNRILGVIFGVALALIVAWAVSMILGFVLELPALSAIGFDGGVVYGFFREYHPLDLLLGF